MLLNMINFGVNKTENCLNLIQKCFNNIYTNMNRIGVEIYSFNERSIKLFESLGVVREGVIREQVYKKGKFVDEYIYGLLRQEWKK
ncbi:GNAT family N-acetyltransferase [Clostridium ihumii]